MHINKIYFNIYYYTQTYFGRFCDHHYSVTHEYHNIELFHETRD